jgi:hypothetical protein
MTFKEWNAAATMLSSIAIAAWVGWDLLTSGPATSLAGAASDMLWAIGASILVSIVAIIVTTILVSIVQRAELRDERSDERDRLVNGKAMRNGYLVLSVGVLAVLIIMAAGLAPELAPYTLFGVALLAGTVTSASELIYYRIG